MENTSSARINSGRLVIKAFPSFISVFHRCSWRPSSTSKDGLHFVSLASEWQGSLFCWTSDLGTAYEVNVGRSDRRSFMSTAYPPGSERGLMICWLWPSCSKMLPNVFFLTGWDLGAKLQWLQGLAVWGNRQGVERFTDCGLHCSKMLPNVFFLTGDLPAKPQGPTVWENRQGVKLSRPACLLEWVFNEWIRAFPTAAWMAQFSFLCASKIILP